MDVITDIHTLPLDERTFLNLCFHHRGRPIHPRFCLAWGRSELALDRAPRVDSDDVIRYREVMLFARPKRNQIAQLVEGWVVVRSIKTPRIVNENYVARNPVLEDHLQFRDHGGLDLGFCGGTP
jgi:hypothetical protein